MTDHLWHRLLAALPASETTDLEEVARAAANRRLLIPHHIGSINRGCARLLRAVCVHVQPRLVVEVGTGLGHSTFALRASSMLYTCDKSHALVASTEHVRCHPGTRSTDLLALLAAADLHVDLFFIDGRVLPPDVELILRLSHLGTWYLFDDYWHSGRRPEKGLANVSLLHPHLPGYVLVPPLIEERNLVAGLVPEGACAV